MGAWFEALYRRTAGRPVVWWLLLALWAAGVSVSLPKLRLVEDIFQALPADRGVRDLRELLASTGAADRTVVAFIARDGVPVDSARTAMDLLVDAIHEAGFEHPPDINTGPDPLLFDDLVALALEHLPVLADSMAVEKLATADGAALDTLVRQVKRALAAPDALVREPLLMGDPAGMLMPWLSRLRGFSDLGGITGESGVYADRTGRALVAFVVPPKEAGPMERERLVGWLRERAALPGVQGVDGRLFGTDVIAVGNRERIASDTRLTMAIAVALIIALLLWYYRRWTIPLFFLLPPVFGMLTALSILAWTAPELSAIALGVSATLLGIALDYSFHFLTHLRHSGNVSRTLGEVGNPLLLGSATTVLAFLGLRFLEAPLLRDLGLLAALMLAASALFVLVVLPHLVGRHTMEATEVRIPRTLTLLAPLRRWTPWVVVAVTIVLWPFIDRVRYEDDPERLNYLEPGTRDLRDRLFGSADELATLFMVADAADDEAARQALEGAVRTLRSAESDVPHTIASPTDLLPSDASAHARLAHWRKVFDEQRAAALVADLRERAGAHGFSLEAFARLEAHVLEPDDHGIGRGEVDLLAPLVPGLVGDAPDGGRRWVAIVRGTSAQLSHAHELLKGAPDVRLLDRGLLADQLSGLVGHDLGRILWITGLLVFGLLWLTYGRIELAVITFVPMALSWLWILGICGLVGIPFNMVNILVCTFIFGLGDDYCIFTSSGILGRYRDGGTDLPAIRAAVVLSAITTMIGTGVLLWAEHPALRSIAVLSVVGLAAILFISLTVQPILFRWLITGRAAKGRFPFTAASLFISLFAFVYFLAGCIVQLMFLPLVALLPTSREWKRRVFGRSLMIFTRSLVYVMANVRKDIQDFHGKIRDTPSIVIANHSSFVDILVMLMVHPRTVMMTNRWVWNSPFFGAFVRFTGFIRSEDDITTNTERVRERMAHGWSVVIFPEGTRSRDGRIGRFHKGAFHMAETLRAPVVPVLLHGVGHAMGKSDAMLKDTTITMRTLPPITWDDPRFGVGYRDRSKAIARQFKARYEELRAERETPAFFRRQLIRNYIYKGPVLEWYMRVKSRVDLPLYERIHALVPPHAHVVDLGCGYGPLSLMLHWCAPGRTIMGVDHDADKVAVATHCFGKGPQVSFQVGDLERYEPGPADVYILKDVLHYLDRGRQGALLRSCAEQLRPGGRILVRDGFSDDAGRHGRTRATEWWSTGLRFNKAKGQLEFLRSDEFVAMAEAAGLRVTWVHRSGRTSNALALLEKP